MTDKTPSKWTENELRIAILKILYDAKQKRPKTGGLNPKLIMDALDTCDVDAVESAIYYLRENGYVDMGDRLFLISDTGVGYLISELG